MSPHLHYTSATHLKFWIPTHAKNPEITPGNPQKQLCQYFDEKLLVLTFFSRFLWNEMHSKHFFGITHSWGCGTPSWVAKSSFRKFFKISGQTLDLVLDKNYVVLKYHYFCNIYRVFFGLTRINTTINRKVNRFLIGLKHFKEEAYRYEMVKTR